MTGSATIETIIIHRYVIEDAVADSKGFWKPCAAGHGWSEDISEAELFETKEAAHKAAHSFTRGPGTRDRPVAIKQVHVTYEIE